jgi:hypothetical protein
MEELFGVPIKSASVSQVLFVENTVLAVKTVMKNVIKIIEILLFTKNMGTVLL